jgi:hypothetical protein
VAGGARATRAYGEARLEDAAGEVLGSRGVERAVERAFAGPLPEHVANAAVEQRVVQRMVAEVLASVDMQAAITDALERERAEGRLEQIVGEAARSQAAEEIAQRVVSSPELQRLIEEVIASDAVRTALARQSASVGGLRPSWLEAAIASVGATVGAVAYLVVFWTVAGQTPGMRAMGLRLVVGRDGTQPPGVGRALLRVVGLVIAIVPFFAGFLPILFDRRRRAIQDMLAGTAVRVDEAHEGG